MTSQLDIRINARMWSPTASLRPIAALIGGASFVLDKGDVLYSTRGAPLKRRAPENYLSIAEVSIANLNAVQPEAARFVDLLNSEPIARMIDDGTLDAVVWIAILGGDDVSVDDLPIDRTPFGSRIGLVIDNFTQFDRHGIPRKLLIGPAASRKSA